jgi:hypothetical protein
MFHFVFELLCLEAGALPRAPEHQWKNDRLWLTWVELNITWSEEHSYTVLNYSSTHCSWNTCFMLCIPPGPGDTMGNKLDVILAPIKAS